MASTHTHTHGSMLDNIFCASRSHPYTHIAQISFLASISVCSASCRPSFERSPSQIPNSSVAANVCDRRKKDEERMKEWERNVWWQQNIKRRTHLFGCVWALGLKRYTESYSYSHRLGVCSIHNNNNNNKRNPCCVIMFYFSFVYMLCLSFVFYALALLFFFSFFFTYIVHNE